jgi:sarcosine oxidase subunit gamma
MSDPNRQQPRIESRAWLAPLPAATRFSFRGGADAALAASRAFGVELPSAACRANATGARAALWLGPDEQLLIAPEGDAQAVRTALASALEATPHSIVDISHRQVAFEVKGPDAEWLLQAGCPLDLDASQFPVGMCTRTVYLKAEIILWRTGADTFRLEIWRSFAEYVLGMLNESALELSA